VDDAMGQGGGSASEIEAPTSAPASTAQGKRRRAKISVLRDGDRVPRKKAKKAEVQGGASEAGRSTEGKADKASLDHTAGDMPKSIQSLTASERATLGLPPLLIKHPNTSMGQHIRFDECELLFCPVVRGSMTFS
jgi:hypothetical protein